MKNYGVNLELEKQHQKDTVWIFGADSDSCDAQIPENERTSCLPLGEIQRGREDFMDCATRSPLNILETKLNFLLKSNKLPAEHRNFLDSNGYITDQGIQLSDRFIAVLSGTTRNGNSLVAPIEALRKNGVIPKKLLPAMADMGWDEYHDKEAITQAMRNLGIRFLDFFSINFEKVLEQDFEALLKKDLLAVAGYAWPFPVNGEYPKNDYQINHAFMAYRTPKYFIFDNYIDSVDGDFIKKLDSQYDLLDYGYRIYLTIQIPRPKVNWWQLIKGFFIKRKVVQ